MSKTLYNRLKPHLGNVSSVLSDAESLLLNRRDFHINQISAVQATLSSVGLDISYPFRVMLSFLDAFALGLTDEDFNIILTDPSLAIGAYHVWLRAGGSPQRGRVFAPKGLPPFPQRAGIVGDLITDFVSRADTSPDAKVSEDRSGLFTFVLGNTKSSAQTLFAVDRFIPVQRGLLLLKDFARSEAFDEREYLESKRIFPAVTFEGHAFVVRL